MRPSVTRTFTTAAPPDVVYDYLVDFTHAEEWDPGTVSCERVSGDGGVGTVHRNVSTFLGTTSEITYTTVEAERPTRIHLTGHNEQFDGHDVMGIRAKGTGSEVTYTAEFAFGGAARLAAPVVAAYLPILAKRTVTDLRARLDGLA